MRLIISAVLALLIICSSAAALAESFEITELTPAGNGDIVIRWSDPEGNGPYRVLFQPSGAHSGDAPDTERTFWCNSGEVEDAQYRESYVVPDASYWFIVIDASGNEALRRYEGESCDFEEAWAVEMSGSSMRMTLSSGKRSYDETGDDRPWVLRFKTDKLLSAGENEYYGVDLKISAREPAFGDYMLKYAVERQSFASGRGAADVIGMMTDPSIPLVLSSAYPSQELFINVGSWFKNAGAEEGPYVLKVYFDGKLAGSVPFEID